MRGARPTIGITVGISGGRGATGVERLAVRRAYAAAVAAAGGLPLLVPPEASPADVVRRCDGFVVTGGADLPVRLGAAAPAAAEHPERVAWDRRLLDRAHAAGRPVLGVCYGMQLLNLHRGGTLLADIAAARPGALDHGGAGRTCEHDVRIATDSVLFPALGAGARVSSRHHQAVDAVAPDLRASASAPDGIVEALEGDGCLGVEWHPEADATGPAVYGWLLAQAAGRS